MTRFWIAGSALALVALAAPLGAQDARREVAALRARGEYARAITLTRREQLHNALGELLVLTGQSADAEAAFARAIGEGRADSLTARLNLAILWYDRGERAAARRAFDTFIDVYNSGRTLTSAELTAVARAVEYLSADDPALAHDALRAYDEAIAADPDNLGPRLHVAALFLQRYNGTEARATVDEILRRHPDNADGLLALARTTRFEGSRRALELVQQSLDQNPRLVPALVFHAELLAEMERYDDADREIDRALDVNPNSLAALSLRAAIAYLRGDDGRFRRTEQRVLDLNPMYAGLYTTVADVSARNRLYAAAARFAQRAIEVDSTSWRGHALLGINQLRAGAMERGRRHLETAFAGDPFDVWTKNTLDLLDTLTTYPRTTSPRFEVYVDGKESALLALYLVPLAEAAYDSLATRYGYRPPAPIRIEVFPDHADFSVRTVGLVGLGALGVSFGPVIAMDSPSARPAGTFNWGSTLWHEIAHTFHLAITDHRVPRWLTEGLAVYEERRAREGWGDDPTPAFLNAYRRERLLPVSRLNDGFMRPAYPQQIAFSYYQASLVCEYIEREYGLPTLLNMLRAYRDGLTGADVFRQVFEMDVREFDDRFDEWFRQRFAGPLAAIPARDSTLIAAPTRAGIVDRARRYPGDYVAQLAMAMLLLRDGDADAAVEYFERAKRLFPEYAGPDSPYWHLARIFRERGDLRRAARELTALTAIHEQSYEAYVTLAELREALGDSSGAADALGRAMYVFPYEIDRHRQLADLAAASGAHDVAVRERWAVLALGPVDRAEAYYKLARALLRAGDRQQARQAVLRALEVAPGYPEAQDLLLEIHGGD